MLISRRLIASEQAVKLQQRSGCFKRTLRSLPLSTSSYKLPYSPFSWFPSSRTFCTSSGSPQASTNTTEKPQFISISEPKIIKQDVPDWKLFSSLLVEKGTEEFRSRVKEVLKDDIYNKKNLRNLSVSEQRQLANKQLEHYAKNKCISVQQLVENPLIFFASHELAALANPSLGSKMTIQFNLWGGSLLKLGTEEHKNTYVSGVDELRWRGCFALTELGYGSNVVRLETTATYEESTDSFIINTPSPQAQKYWITNGASFANVCIVFAQLHIGEKNHGIHAFVVPLRQENGSVMEGIQLFDIGDKFGLVGIDSARIIFNNVRVPRNNLLNRFSQVESGGAFTSSITKERDRFLKVADQLLTGRLCIATSCLAGAKACLTAAIRYSIGRLGAGPTGDSDTPVINYGAQLKPLVTLLARTYAFTLAVNYCKEFYTALQQEPHGPEESNRLVTLICVMKALVTWHASETGNVCRERTGGLGFLLENLFADTVAAAHGAMTAEGDNMVLMQKVTKDRLTDFGKKMTMWKFVRLKLSNLYTLDPLVQSSKSIEKMATFLNKRESNVILSLSTSLTEARGKDKAAKSNGEEMFKTWTRKCATDIQRYGKAYGEKVALDVMVQQHSALTANKSGHPLQNSWLIEKLGIIFALDCIERDAGFFLSNKIISPQEGRLLSSLLEENCYAVKDHLSQLVDAFDIPDYLLGAPIAGDWMSYYSSTSQK